jgi:hypothetical protein
MSPVECYMTITDRLHCLVTVTNSDYEALEGLAIQITLFDEESRPIDSKVAHSPLNLVPVGSVMPLKVEFSPAGGGYSFALASPRSAIEAEDIGSRYINLLILRTLDEPGEGNSSWVVGGNILASGGENARAERIAVLATALDASGHAVGFRMWERTEGISAGEEIPFKLTVQSYGPPIDHVELLAEGLLRGISEE